MKGLSIRYLYSLSHLHFYYYTRLKNKFYKDVKIRYYSIVKGKYVRKIFIFRVELILFKKVFNSTKKILIPYTFVLIDV